MTTYDMGRLAPLLVAAALLGGACSGGDDCEEQFGGAGCTLDGQIVNSDTTLFTGESASFAAAALYGIGLGVPTSISWGTSDTSKISVFVRTDLSASVTAKDSGNAYLIALINQEFLDSVLISIVIRGGPRWRATFTDSISLQPAIGDSVVHVVTGGGSPQLRMYDPDGTAAAPVGSCFSRLGPSLGLDDETYVTGPQCTRRHAATGTVDWTATVGSGALGVAIATDGGAFTVTQDSIFRISPAGAVSWGAAIGGPPVTAPVISADGDVTVGFRIGGADSVARFTATGTERWTVPVPGLSVGTPAISGTRLIVPRPGGLFSLDSSSAINWDHSFMTDLASATATGATSSPVIDDAGVVFVQNTDGLFSYTTGGVFLWAVDSLGYGATSGPVGAPTLLGNGTLAVPCTTASGREACIVRQATGVLSYRTTLGGGDALGLAVGETGLVYVTRALTAGGTELVALWERVAPELDGWPAAGRDQRRSRRQ